MQVSTDDNEINPTDASGSSVLSLMGMSVIIVFMAFCVIESVTTLYSICTTPPVHAKAVMTCNVDSDHEYPPEMMVFTCD